jgi:hypothetical protein
MIKFCIYFSHCNEGKGCFFCPYKYCKNDYRLLFPEDMGNSIQKLSDDAKMILATKSALCSLPYINGQVHSQEKLCKEKG